MNIKNWSTFNELYRGTYFRAANLLNKKQPNRSKALRDHGEEKGLYKNFFITNFPLDIYVHFTIDKGGGREIYPRKIVRNVLFEDYFTSYETDLGAFHLNVDEFYLEVSISFEGDKPEIIFFDKRNKLINRRSALNLMKLMHRFYLYHDPNVMRKVSSKISGTKTTPLTFDDVDDNNFWKFLQQNGYDWNEFKNSININDLWDRIE